MRPRLTSLTLAACVLGGCSRGSPDTAPPGLDLLARTPDTLVDQPGVLVPDGENAWRPYGQFGWERWADHDWVWSARTSAFLNLPAGPARERTLVLTLRSPEEGQRTVRVKLNGVALGELPLSSQAAEQRVTAPASTWREGENLLELTVDKLTPSADGKRRVGLALSRVVYEEPTRARIDRESRRAELAAGNALGYRLEPLAPGKLHLAGRARGAGELRLAFLRVDRTNGAPLEELLSLPIALDGEGLQRQLTLPDVGGDLLEFRLNWRGDKKSRFELQQLRLEEEQPVRRFPIIFISIDTLSARHLSLHGFSLATTPELERFARQAIVFERCLANAPWTLPSFMSLWSGLPPGAHRLKSGQAGSELWEQWYLAQDRWTLAESLRAAGYPTAGFVDNFWITERFGLTQGFELYDSTAGENEKTDPDGGIRQVLGEAREFLAERQPAEPVFLFLHAFDVHGPYSPPAPFRGRFAAGSPYDPERTAPAGGPSDAFGIIASYIARGAVPEGALPPALETAPLARAYDEGIAMIDSELGQFFDWLERRGILEHALVIVTADHGEAVAGEHYLFGHGVLDEEVLQVPLIVHLPGGAGGGRRIGDPVQLLDLYPTLLDLVGSRASRAALPGRSLLPLLEGGTREPEPILCEGGLMRQAALYDKSWKLVEQEFRDAAPSVLLSALPLTPGWLEAAESRLREQKIDDSLLAWRDDQELVADLFERLPRTGLTEELFARMRSRAGFNELVNLLHRALANPRYELFDLAADPLARNDVLPSSPGRAAELKELLKAEQARRETARDAVHPPNQPVELSPQDVDQLQGLGYGGKH